MKPHERVIIGAFLAWLALVLIVGALRGAEKPMPQPDAPVERYGCDVTQTKDDPNVMGAWFVRVWAEGKALAGRWIRLLSVRPLEKDARRHALADCDLWMKQMERKANAH